MNRLALLALVCVGCATTGNPFKESDPKSQARHQVEGALLKAAENALTTPTQLPSRHTLSQSGRSGILLKAAFSEQNFRYAFRLVKNAADPDREKSWALREGDYARVIRSIFTEVSDAVAAGGGKVVEGKCDGSTFLIRYEAAIRGRPATGTIQGWVGPEDVNNHKPPLTEPYYSVISVDLREETERR